MHGTATLQAPAPAAAGTGAAAQLERVQTLQNRIRHMQRRTLESRTLPTLPPLAELLPGGALHCGVAYSVQESHALVMALLAGPSGSGAWCGLVGLPDFGVEAAAGFGINLDRLVLVPHPGEQWLSVTAALADVLQLVVTRPPTRARDADAARLAARLRQRGSTLIAVGAWPQSEARLSVVASRWNGLNSGSGRLTDREATITVTVDAGLHRSRSGRLRLPASDAGLGRLPAPAAAESAESVQTPQLRAVV
ncbi:MAG: hypothetical protein ABI255_11560 [Microbacteriaceae bacterium]